MLVVTTVTLQPGGDHFLIFGTGNLPHSPRVEIRGPRALTQCRVFPTMHAMRKTVLSLLLLSALPLSASARIGETYDQCKARYGDPIDQATNATYFFKKSGLYFSISFHEGVADCITFRKVAENEINIADEISDNEIAQLMTANAGGRPWKKSKLINMNRTWFTEDGQVFCEYHSMDHFLVIGARGYFERKAAAKKAKEDQNLQGF